MWLLDCHRSSVPVVFLVAILIVVCYAKFAESQLVVPTNVTATPLSTTSALVSWALMDDNASLSSSSNSSSQHYHRHNGQMGQHNQSGIGSPLRMEIIYRPVQDRQRMIVPVPIEVTSYVLRDLRPGGVYAVSVSSYSRGYGRVRSPPVHLVMSPILPATTTPTPPALLPPLIPSPPLTHHRRPVNTYGNANLPEGDYYYGNSNPTGVVLVRGEEVGIVVLVLVVWVGAVALFFHRWGKIRMLLPYQPVFKEEVGEIGGQVLGCSPSPTLHPQLPRQSSLGTQSQCGSPAVLVSANKFVSLDPAAIRRNQFMLHSRLSRMQAYTERRNVPKSLSPVDSPCIIVGRTSPRPVRQQAYAGRRANTIASACDGEHPARAHTNPTGSQDSAGSAEMQPPQRRKAHSAEVITLTVTECDTESPSSSSNSTPTVTDLALMEQRSCPATSTAYPSAMAECAL